MRELWIEGDLVENSCLFGRSYYFGGAEGASEWSWMRICTDGSRVDIGEPRAVDPSFPYPTPAHHDPRDPRVLALTADDVGCRLKAKCRPVRSDGEGGYVATSKPTQVVTPDAAADA